MVFRNRVMENWFQRLQENVIKYTQTYRQVAGEEREGAGGAREGNAIFDSKETFWRAVVSFVA